MSALNPEPAPATPQRKDKWTSGEAYELWMARWSRLLAPLFLDWLEVPPAAVWLDLCCGTGIVTQAITENCRPTRIVGVDRTPPLLDFARQHRSAPHVEYQLADAVAL